MFSGSNHQAQFAGTAKRKKVKKTMSKTRTEAHEEMRRKVWADAVNAAMNSPEPRNHKIADEIADQVLQAFDKRFNE